MVVDSRRSRTRACAVVRCHPASPHSQLQSGRSAQGPLPGCQTKAHCQPSPWSTAALAHSCAGGLAAQRPGPVVAVRLPPGVLDFRVLDVKSMLAHSCAGGLAAQRPGPVVAVGLPPGVLAAAGGRGAGGAHARRAAGRARLQARAAAVAGGAQALIAIPAGLGLMD